MGVVTTDDFPPVGGGSVYSISIDFCLYVDCLSRKFPWFHLVPVSADEMWPKTFLITIPQLQIGSHLYATCCALKTTLKQGISPLFLSGGTRKVGVKSLSSGRTP